MGHIVGAHIFQLVFVEALEHFEAAFSQIYKSNQLFERIFSVSKDELIW